MTKQELDSVLAGILMFANDHNAHTIEEFINRYNETQVNKIERI